MQANQKGDYQLTTKEVMLFAMASGAALIGCLVAALKSQGILSYLVFALILAVLFIGGGLFYRLGELRKAEVELDHSGGRAKISDKTRGPAR